MKNSTIFHMNTPISANSVSYSRNQYKLIHTSNILKTMKNGKIMLFYKLIDPKLCSSDIRHDALKKFEINPMKCYKTAKLRQILLRKLQQKLRQKRHNCCENSSENDLQSFRSWIFLDLVLIQECLFLMMIWNEV